LEAGVAQIKNSQYRTNRCASGEPIRDIARSNNVHNSRISRLAIRNGTEMLEKFIAIKNVGRFRNSAAVGNLQLTKLTLILGANGFGKTTICALLRSLQTGDPSHVLGRRRLGVTDAPLIELLLDTGQVRFDGANWSATQPTIAIFDGVFVADNVHSGEVVDIEHKRNLYRVIVGDEGVKLAAEDAKLAAASRTKTGEISAAAKAIQTHVPAGMKLDVFLALPATADIDDQITEQERRH
jgi:wobble nucleotide-excising tRNase